MKPAAEETVRARCHSSFRARQRRGNNSGGAAGNRDTGERGAADSTRKGSELSVRQNTSGDMPSFFVRLFGSLIRIEFHLSRQHVGFLSRYRATTN